MIPDYWKDFIESNGIIHAEVEIPKSRDLSKVGAEFQIMSAEDSEDESKNFYPGLVVRKDGYIPVGSCSIGSGDPYFINEKDGKNGALYRIYHDSVFDENCDKEKAIELVLKNYEDIVKE